MTLPVILFVAAVILGLVEELQADGRSLSGWAVIAIGVGLLWGTHFG